MQEVLLEKECNTLSCPNSCACTRCQLPTGLNWNPIERLTSSPSFDEYLCKYALPHKPFIIEAGCAKTWKWPLHDGRWSRIDYFREHPDVLSRSSQEVSSIRFRSGQLIARDTMSIGDALSKLSSCKQHGCSDEKMYLCAWEYDPPEDEVDRLEDSIERHLLAADIGSGVPFVQCLLASSSNAGLNAKSQMMRWIFIGEDDTGTPTHVDPIASHAWMWMADGEKEWRVLAPEAENRNPLEKPNFPNLFQCSSVAACGSSGTLWFATLRCGEFLFVPSGSFHSVWNSSPTVALTHNYIDAACLFDMLGLLSSSLHICHGALVCGIDIEEILEECENKLGSLLCGLVAMALNDLNSIEGLVRVGVGSLSDRAPSSHLLSRDILSIWSVCKNQIVEINQLLFAS